MDRTRNDLIEHIIAQTAVVFVQPPVALVGESRRQDVVIARQAAMWVIRRRYPSIALFHIGVAFGGRHFSTVRHALAAVDLRVARDPRYAAQIQRILSRIDPLPRPAEPSVGRRRIAHWWLRQRE